MFDRNEKLNRRQVLALGSAALATALPAHGQARWPDKPIKMVLPFPPGGGTDVMLRAMTDPLREILGQSILVINKPGGGGVLAATEVIRAEPDGLTFFVGPSSQESIVPFIMDVNIDTVRDLKPVAAIVRFQNHLVVRSDSPFKDLKDFVAYARQNPKKLNYGSAGTGTMPHIVGELLMQRAGIQMTHVPYKGAGPALQAVLGGEVDAVFDPGVSFPHVNAGKLRMIAIASGNRSPYFPNVPTTVDQGFTDVQMDMLTGMWAPAATPPRIVEQMAAAIEKVATSADFQKKMSGMGAQPMYMPPPAFTKFVRDETRVLSELIKERKIRAE